MFERFFNKKIGNAKYKKLIIVIGFNKTGTTSIHRLFQLSGFQSIHWDQGKLTKTMLINAINGKPILQGYDEQYDIYSDLVYRNDSFWFEGNSLFKQIDQYYPNALFIYNHRDMDAWLDSRCQHAEQLEEQTILDLHKNLLNTDDITKIKNYWKSIRVNFEKDLDEYFSARTNLLKVDIEDKDFIKKLSTFIQFELNPCHWGRFNKT